MKITCNIIKDILPLVAEDLVSEDTVKLVNDHLISCPKCTEEYKDLKSPKVNYEVINKSEALPLKSIGRKLKNKNIYVGLLSSLLVCLLLVITINIATKPIPLSYADAIESRKTENGKLFIEFSPRVSNYSVVSYGPNYDIMAWQTKISKIFDRNEGKNTVINIDDKKATKVVYIDQLGGGDRLLYGGIDGQGQLSLPRLAMNYYLIIMFFLFAASIFLYFIFRNTNKLKKTFKIITILSLSYILGHLSIFAGSGATHHMIRDLSLVLISTILYFSIIILLLYKESFFNLGRKIEK